MEQRKVAIYIRVSSVEQREEGLSLEVQERRLVKYANDKDWLVFKIYRDEGKSGTDIKGRKAFQELLNDSKKNKFSAVLVTKLDRAFRSVKDALRTIEDFNKLGIDLISLTENIDTTSAMGKVMFTMISAFAQFERDITSDRVKDVQKDKIERGILPGKAPFGYKPIIRDKKVVGFTIHQKEAEIVQDAFLMASTRHSYKEICKKHGLKPQSYYNIIRNKVYIGIISFEGKERKGTHPALISEELFAKCQKQSP